MSVLVLSHSRDGLNTSAVIERIECAGHQVIRMDVDSISNGKNSLTIRYEQGGSAILSIDNMNISLCDEVESVWFRRPYYYDFNIKDPAQRKVAEEEIRDVLEGIWLMLRDKYWISSPQSINIARNKPYMNKIASLYGLLVPDTLITNNTNEAKEFISKGPTVFKPIAGYHFEYDDYIKTAYTTLITDFHMKHLDLIRAQHVMLQRYITKCFEVRSTYVGGKLFSCKLEHPDYSNIVDWRTPSNNDDITYSEIQLPDIIEEKIHLLLGSLGLEYAAIDFAVDQYGNYYFLEVNPIGQWLWIEHSTGMPISEALASSLIRR